MLQLSLKKREVFKDHHQRSRVNKEGAGCSLKTPEKKKAGEVDHWQPRLSAMMK